MYLGIDPSLTQTGWALVNSKGSRLSSGIFPHKLNEEASPKEKILRIIAIEDEVLQLIKKYKPIAIAIEGYAFAKFQSRSNNVLNLAELGGVLRRLFVKEGYNFQEYAPSKVKLFGTGSGNCKKELILKEVYKNFQEDFTTSDEADAFIIAKLLYTVESYKKNTNISLRDFERRAVEEILGIKKSKATKRKKENRGG